MIVAAAILTLARLLELLEYFPDTGLFVWRVNRARLAKAGTVAGGLDSYGYIRIRIHGRKYRAHRLAWFYMTGKWPIDEIDHIDGNPSNNRFDNLREAIHRQNRQNLREPTRDNQCGFLGVSKRGNRWRAIIVLDGKHTRLGNFSTPELAHAAYVAAKRRIHPFGTL